MRGQHIERIPIRQIRIVRPRLPNRRIYQMIFANIRECGLKKPITVVHRKEPDEDGKQFDLVCGYARLEAFIALGEKTIPAIIIKTSPEDPAQRALAENSCEGTAY